MNYENCCSPDAKVSKERSHFTIITSTFKRKGIVIPFFTYSALKSYSHFCFDFEEL